MRLRLALRLAAYLCAFGMFVFLGCGGEVAVSIPGCENCPERCLLDNSSSKGRCVPCLKDTHCQSDTSP
ncbi:MAG: hypothetical protein EP343_25855, partial [Deltaproteobacteria bacterium]